MNRMLLFIAISTCLGTSCLGQSTLKPADLRCERMVNPLGVDYQHPRLSWICEASDPAARGLRQTAYCVQVASSPEKLARNKPDLWDSGKVSSDATAGILYGGKPLASRQRVFWRVRIWDQGGRPSAWGAPQEWTAGILNPRDWRGHWIASDLDLMPYQKELKSWPDEDRDANLCAKLWGLGGRIREMAKDADTAPAVYMRREFEAPKSIRRAVVFASGLGCFELHINGRFFGPNLLDPAMCDYQKRVPYVVRDVTRALKQGRNTIGVVLGNGWFNPISPLFHGYYRADFISPPQLRMDMEIHFTDGSMTIIGTSPKWKYTTGGPIRYNCFAGGETYDARKEMPGWSAPGFDDTAWKPAKTVRAPSGRMSAQVLYPVRALEEIPSAKVEKVGDDRWRFTLRENAGGVPRLKLHAKPGQIITINCLGASGHTFGRYQTDIFVAKGGEEVYQPSLTYHGFGAVDVSGLGYEPKAGALVGVVTATDLPVVGGFSCSDERLNRLQDVFRRTVYNYIIGLPNDPVREKSAWTQDVWNQFVAESWFYDVGPTYRKWQLDFRDGQFPDGYLGPVVPGRFEGPDINGPWWGGAIVYTPWLYYQTYGDASLLAESYEGMKRHFAYLEQLCTDDTVRKTWCRQDCPNGKDILWWGLGDWLGIETQKPRIAYTSTAALSWFARILSDTAQILGREEDHVHFENRAKEIRETFNHTFLNPETGAYDLKGGQTSQALALALGLVPKESRAKVEARLVKSIEEADNHITCGFVGTPILLTTLSDIGRPDLAWTVATQPGGPGWFNIVRQGTYQEDWGGGGVQMPSLAAPIHCWFMQDLAGIRPDSAGSRRVVLKPDLVGGLTWVKAWHQGPNGRISSAWKINGKAFRWELIIPANTTATVCVPSKDSGSVKESGKAAKQARGLKYVRFEDGQAVFEAGSGRYLFESEM